MRIGIIGAGTIGQLLASRFVESGKIRPSEVIVSDTDKAKLGALQSKGIRAAESNRQAVECSDLVFLCIRPQDLTQVLDEIAECSQGNRLFVSTVAAVNSAFYRAKLKNLKLVRIIPSIANQFESGAVLYAVNDSTTEKDEKMVLGKIALLGKPYKVEEERLDSLTHLSSCGPAFIAYFLQHFLGSVECQEEGNAAEEILLETLKGTTRLLEEQGFGFIDRVCTKGGITQEGINTMSGILPVLERMALKAKEKHSRIREEVEQNACI